MSKMLDKVFKEMDDLLAKHGLHRPSWDNGPSSIEKGMMKIAATLALAAVHDRSVAQEAADYLEKNQ